MKVGIVSLGCAKNLVDSESIAYLFQDNKVDIVNNIRVWKGCSRRYNHSSYTGW